MDTDSFISVVLASYNGEKYIREQLESILCQLPKKAEVIVSDDGSSDSTREIVQEFSVADPRVHLVDGPKKGIKKNVENGIRQTQLYQNSMQGYLFLADQDDVWMNNKVEKVLNSFKSTGADLVIHDAEVVNGDMTKVLMSSYFEYRRSHKGILYNIFRNTYVGCCMAFKSSCIPLFLPIPDHIEMHDQWIGICNEIRGGKVEFLRENLLRYRRHENTMTGFQHHSLWKMCINRIVFCKQLVGYYLRAGRIA